MYLNKEIVDLFESVFRSQYEDALREISSTERYRYDSSLLVNWATLPARLQKHCLQEPRKARLHAERALIYLPDWPTGPHRRIAVRIQNTPNRVDLADVGTELCEFSAEITEVFEPECELHRIAMECIDCIRVEFVKSEIDECPSCGGSVCIKRGMSTMERYQFLIVRDKITTEEVYIEGTITDDWTTGDSVTITGYKNEPSKIIKPTIDMPVIVATCII